MRDLIENIINPGGDGKTIVQHKPIGKDRLEIIPHGHVVARGDKIKARCGGPEACAHCVEERRRLDAGTWPHEVPSPEMSEDTAARRV